MYKRLTLLFLFLVLTGCNSRTQTKQIDLKNAQAIASSYYPNCEITSITYNNSNTTPNYSIHLVDDLTSYQIIVDATNGSVTEYSRTALSQTPVSKINQADAKEMALKLHPGEIIKCDLDTSENIPYYEIIINDGTYEYEIEINAVTGDVMELDQEITKS